MRKTWLTLAFVVLLTAPLVMMAQTFSKAEIFGGYSYERASGGTNLNGWEASVTGNVIPWLGLEADLSGHYGTYNSHSFLFGPRFAIPGMGKFTPYVHALFGAVHDSSGGIFANTSFGTALGGGLDVELIKPVAVRVIQVDDVVTHFNSTTQNNARISTGLVFRF